VIVMLEEVPPLVEIITIRVLDRGGRFVLHGKEDVGEAVDNFNVATGVRRTF